MTTNVLSTEQTPRVLRAGVVAGAGTGAGGALLAALTSDSGAVRGVLAGAGSVVAFYLFGTVVVGLAARVAPTTALLVALLTYTLQVVLVGVLFTALVRSGRLGEDLRPEWLAGGLIAATFAWIAAQIAVTLRTPIPAWVAPVDPSSVSHPEGDAA